MKPLSIHTHMGMNLERRGQRDFTSVARRGGGNRDDYDHGMSRRGGGNRESYAGDMYRRGTRSPGRRGTREELYRRYDEDDDTETETEEEEEEERRRGENRGHREYGRRGTYRRGMRTLVPSGLGSGLGVSLTDMERRGDGRRRRSRRRTPERDPNTGRFMSNECEM